MFGMEWLFAELETQCAITNAAQRKMAHDMWNISMIRGPMVEADIDWRVPNSYRAMREGDL